MPLFGAKKNKFQIMITNGKIYEQILSGAENNEKQIAILIDPDKTKGGKLEQIIKRVERSVFSYIFVGGSLISSNIDTCIEIIKSNTGKPVILFPGSYTHISLKADAILLLSLLSGRNPDYLIGNHVLAASKLYLSGLEVISTAYILIDGGNTTSVQYISNTQPIPADKPDIVVATAIAGEMIGNKLIYLEAGSGAKNSVHENIITEVKKHCNIPIITGGGLKSKKTIENKFLAGTNIAVVGSAIESNPNLISKL